MRAEKSSQKWLGRNVLLPYLRLKSVSNSKRVSGVCDMHMGMTEFATPTAIETPTTTGICAGTTVLTLNGEMAIENVKAGDRIITRDCGMTHVKSIKASTVTMEAIRIKAGSLGHSRPDRDMLAAPGAKLHIRDWRAEALFGKPTASVAAERLVDGEFLSKQPEAEMTVYEITFDRAHIIYADGIEMVAGA